MLHMIASGNSGELDSILAVPQNSRKRPGKHSLRTGIDLEPIMLLFMGGVVALIVAAIMLPILELQQMVQ